MIVSALAALALFAAPEAAGEAAPAAAPAAEAKPAAAAPKKKCVKQPEISGSRLAKKVCVVEKPKAEAPAATAPAEAQADAAEKPAA